MKTKKSMSKGDKGKKKRDPADIFALVKKKDVVGLEDFLLGANAEEVFWRHRQRFIRPSFLFP
jgi:hypothetical protein